MYGASVRRDLTSVVGGENEQDPSGPASQVSPRWPRTPRESGTHLSPTSRRPAAETRARVEEARSEEETAALRLLVGGVVHDLNNLLMLVQSHAQFLARRLGPRGAAREEVQQITDASKRAAALVAELHRLLSGREKPAEVVEIDAVVAGMEGLLHAVAGGSVQLHVEPSREPARVLADPCQIERVLVNLVVNARDATPDGGEIRIETGTRTLDAGEALDAGVPRGDYVEIRVSDTGEGMDEATLGRIFEPLFTTKAPGKGTGLGLATVAHLVRRAGGHVDVTSRLGVGTTFTILLPRR